MQVRASRPAAGCTSPNGGYLIRWVAMAQHAFSIQPTDLRKLVERCQVERSRRQGSDRLSTAAAGCFSSMHPLLASRCAQGPKSQRTPFGRSPAQATPLYGLNPTCEN